MFQGIWGNNLNYQAPRSANPFRVPNAAEQAALNLGVGLLGIDWVRSGHAIKKIKQDIFDPAKMAPSITRTRDADGDENMEKLNDGSAGKSTPGGTGADVQQVIIHNPTSASHGKLVFKKTFQVYTAGFTFSKASILPLTGAGITTNPFVSGAFGFLTPLAVVNPDKPLWYMTPAQWGQLPDFSYASHAKIKITPLGYRLPFATNEAASGYANSQTLVQIATMTGINTMWNTINAGYTTSTSNLHTPTGYAPPPNLYNVLYGGDGTIGASMGIPRHLNQYTTIVSQTKIDVPLLDQLCVVNVNDCKGTPVVNYSHEFKQGLLKAPEAADELASYIQRRQMGKNAAGQTTFPCIPKAVGENGISLDVGEAFGSGDRSHSNLNSNNSIESILSSIDFNTNIEKAPYYNNQLGQSAQPDRPPLINIGVLPVQSNAALTATPTFSDVVCQWLIQTELHVNYNMNYATSGVIPLQYLKAMDPEVWGSTPFTTLSNDVVLVSNRVPRQYTLT